MNRAFSMVKDRVDYGKIIKNLLRTQRRYGMIEIKKECTGCMACVNSCPVGAVIIKQDEYGFVMPCIDTEKCISCGQCDCVCPIAELPEGSVKKAAIESGEWKSEPVPIAAWSMFHKDEDVVKISSSGGVYYALAKKAVDQGGIAFGCLYDMNLREARLEDTDSFPIEALLTSKYVESYIGEDGFKRVLAEVIKGRQVLFCGTPCQAAGLRSYLGRDYDNLLIADFACGGVAAQPYLSDYLKSLEEERGSEIISFGFRDKHYGWGQYCFSAHFADGSTYRKTAMSDPYFFSFLRSSMQRLSCHGCHFSDAHRSDVCLSDFWRCEFFDVERNERKGLSMALAFTEKGKKALSRLKDVMHMEELPVDGASYHLKSRFCPESKIEEIYRDMGKAYNEGVKALRESLLSDEQLKEYEHRQQIMDDEKERMLHPEIVGYGQIVPRK